MLARALAFAALLTVARASLVIPWLNVTVFCVTVGRYLGSQDTGTAAAAPMLILDRAPCRGIAEPAELRGRAVLFDHDAKCGDKAAFDILVRHGVRAIVKSSPFPYPESDWFKRPEASADGADVVMVKYAKRPGLIATLADTCPVGNCTVRASPDPNPYILRHHTWAFQLIDVWIPGVLDLGGFLLTVVFIGVYVHLMRTGSPGRSIFNVSSMGRYIQPALLPLRYYPLVVLVLCLIIGLVMGLYRVVGGSDSTGLLPLELDRLFSSQMAGLQFTTTILASRFWSFMINPIQALPSSAIRRFMMGANLRADIVLFAVIFGVDAFLMIMLTLHWDYDHPVFFISFALYSMIELALAMWITMASATAMYRFFLSSQALRTMTPERRSFAVRITWCAFGIGLSHLYYLVVAFNVTMNPDFFFSPDGLTYINGGFFLSKALQNFFVICMFKPKTLNGQILGNRVRGLHVYDRAPNEPNVPAPLTETQ